jgi:hypothetical protein
MDILEEIGDFTRIGFELFFVETDKGNYVYDRLANTLSQFGGSYFSYLEQNDILKVKFKGKHKIRDYCGNGVKVL